MRSQRGMALITALMMLAFLTVVGGALLSSTTVDLMIAENYETNAKLLYLTEAGLNVGRETLRASANDLSTDMATAAGVDTTLAVSMDLATLLATDDQPLLPSEGSLRTTGQTLDDGSGQAIGTYHVFVRNDPADGQTATSDSNDVVTLVSIGTIGNATLTIAADVKKGTFPPIPAALTLNGGIGLFDAANSNLFRVDGFDSAGSGNNENAIGVISSADDTTVTNAIPPVNVANYTGDGGVTPDVEDISTDLSGMLETVSGLEDLVSSMSESATDTYTPGFGNSTSIGNIGSSSDDRVVVVNGDATFGPGTGYGVLLVRGVLTFSGNFNWNGLVLVIGQGEMHWNGGGLGEIQGGLFIAKTRDTATASVPLGALRTTRGDIIADFNGGGGAGIVYNTSTIANANSTFPYDPIAVWEY